MSEPSKIEDKTGRAENRKSQFANRKSGLNYFARQVGAEKATMLQVGSPFDYEQQMKLFVAGKMPDPREAGYEDALIHWIEHFIQHDARQSVRAVHEFQADAGGRGANAAVLRRAGARMFCARNRHAALAHAGKI